jgi:protein-S-isoprenylcysteine O-methyltransferase Ste14
MADLIEEIGLKNPAELIFSSGTHNLPTMDAHDQKSLRKKIVLLVPALFLLLAAIFFIPAGTLDYWEAWVYCAVLFIPLLFVLAYLLKKDPELLARRMRLKEKQSTQRLVVGISGILFLIGFLIPGLDHRFGWSHIPVEAVLAADLLVILGYTLVFLVFRENPFTSRVVEVEAGQQVISTGPYALVRHPMYLGTSIMWIATPVALGSYWALPVFLIMPLVLVFRIRNEEEVLLRELPGYREYLQKARYRLVPGIW